MSLHRTVQLLGFKQPVVKGEHIVFDVACAAGEIMAVQITRSLWRQLDTAMLAAEIASRPVATGPRKTFTRRETGAAMQAAWAELVAGSRVKLADIAARHGLAEMSLGNWCRRNHPADYAAIMLARKCSKQAAAAPASAH